MLRVSIELVVILSLFAARPRPIRSRGAKYELFVPGRLAPVKFHSLSFRSSVVSGLELGLSIRTGLGLVRLG